MGFFDFVGTLPLYEDHKGAAGRLNGRYHFLIRPYFEQIRDARVLDLGAHDGRWSYAFAGAGAREVIGIEARQNLIDSFDAYPDPDLRAKVQLRRADIFAALEQEIAAGARYDIVAVFGIFYHIMDHFRLLYLIRQLQPGLVIVDTELSDRPGPVITLSRERTAKDLNAAPQIEGQDVAVKGIPSAKAVVLMADALNYDLNWADWTRLPPHLRSGVGDYFRTEGTYRDTFTLTPR